MSNSCGSNTLIMGRPSQNQSGCASGCDTGGFCPPGIGPRKQREATREALRDHIQLMLGAPALRLELDDQQLDHAIDLAFDVFEDYAPRDYFDYYTFPVVPGKSVYKMPPDVGVIRNVFFKQVPTVGLGTGAYDLDGVIPLDYFYGNSGGMGSGMGGMMSPQYPVWGNMGEWVLFKEYENMYSNITGNKGGWEWVSDHQHIKIYPGSGGFCSSGGMVAVHYLQRCKDWNKSTQALREGSLAYAKEMLGRIRSKYTGTYGPANSGMQLDGATLLAESQAEKKQWFDDLLTKYGDFPMISWG